MEEGWVFRSPSPAVEEMMVTTISAATNIILEKSASNIRPLGRRKRLRAFRGIDTLGS